MQNQKTSAEGTERPYNQITWHEIQVIIWCQIITVYIRTEKQRALYNIIIMYSLMILLKLYYAIILATGFIILKNKLTQWSTLQLLTTKCNKCCLLCLFRLSLAL